MRAGFVGLWLVCGALAVSVVPGVRAAPGFDVLWDGVVQCVGYLLAAGLATALAFRRSTGVGVDRRVPAVIAVALVLRALAFVWQVWVVRPSGSTDPPSVADVGWVLSGVTLVVALTLLARTHRPRQSRTLVLDAVLGSLTAGAVVVALLYAPLLRLTGPGTPAAAVVTNLAYPVIDVVLLGLVAGLWPATRGRVAPAVVVMGLGISLIAVVDVVYLYQAAAGTFRPGSMLSPLSLAGTALVASTGGWRAEPDRQPPRERAAGLLVPIGLSLVCVGVLVVDAGRVAPLGGSLLAAAGIVVALVRGYVTLVVDREVAGKTVAVTLEELARFQALVAASSDFIAIGDTSGRLLYLNPGGRRMVGIAPGADVTRTRVTDYLTPEGLERWRQVRRPQILQQGHWEGESWLRDQRGGPPIPVVTSTFTLEPPGAGTPTLMATIQRDISERLDAERALRELADQRQVLLDHLVQAQEDERSRIAADVHDDSVQALAAVELRLSLLQRDLPPDRPELLETVETLRGTVQGATDRLRHLLFDLESPAQRTDLPTALTEAAAYVLEDGVQWRVEGDGGRDLSTATRVTAYRIAKEAMTNARRHAHAAHVVVGLCDDADGRGGLLLTVADDGQGFDPSAAARPGHLGLQGMRDRAAVAGGRLDVRSGPGAGTTVELWLPAHPALAESPDGPEPV